MESWGGGFFYREEEGSEFGYEFIYVFNGYLLIIFYALGIMLVGK